MAEQPLHKAWLGLGANIGDPGSQLEGAIARLHAHPGIVVTARSALHLTAPWGNTDQPDFLNAAVAIETSLAPLELLDACQTIENQMGRMRREHWGPRVIDIDIIAYERLEMTSDELTLPHRYAYDRDFVLMPLREISPETAEWILATAKS